VGRFVSLCTAWSPCCIQNRVEDLLSGHICFIVYCMKSLLYSKQSWRFTKGADLFHCVLHEVLVVFKTELKIYSGCRFVSLCIAWSPCCIQNRVEDLLRGHICFIVYCMKSLLYSKQSWIFAKGADLFHCVLHDVLVVFKTELKIY